MFWETTMFSAHYYLRLSHKSIFGRRGGEKRMEEEEESLPFPYLAAALLSSSFPLATAFYG